MQQPTSITLGKTYTDRLTGFTGIATSVIYYLDGTSQATLVNSDKPDGLWLGTHRLTDAERGSDAESPSRAA